MMHRNILYNILAFLHLTASQASPNHPTPLNRDSSSGDSGGRWICPDTGVSFPIDISSKLRSGGDEGRRRGRHVLLGGGTFAKVLHCRLLLAGGAFLLLRNTSQHYFMPFSEPCQHANLQLSSLMNHLIYIVILCTITATVWMGAAAASLHRGLVCGPAGCLRGPCSAPFAPRPSLLAPTSCLLRGSHRPQLLVR